MEIRVGMIAMWLVCSVDGVAAEDVLTRARESAMRIRSADYLFEYEPYYVDFQWFRFQEERARFEAVITARSQQVDAYNGEIYQSFTPISRTLVVSQEPMDPEGFIGPCRTPLEVCYDWLRVGADDMRYDWQTFRDPDVWDRLRPEPEVIERTINGAECLGVDFVHPNGTISRVYFDVEHGYFPVRREWMRSQNDLPRLRTEVTELTEVAAEEGPIWFPVHVIHDTTDYVVQLEWLHVNEPLDESVFTIPTTDAARIYDRDSGAWTIPAAGQ